MTIASQNPLSYEGVKAPNPPTVFVGTAAPGNNNRADIGDIWVDKSANVTYECSGYDASGNPVWTVTGTNTSTVLDVPHGGTGRATLTNHGVLVGAGTSAITQLSVGATGTVLAGSTGADPAFTASPSVTTLTATTVNATTFDTNVAAAGVTLAGTTLAADGTDADIDINITPKGTGAVNLSEVNITGGLIDDTAIGDNTPSQGAFTNLVVTTSYTQNAGDMIITDGDISLSTAGNKLIIATGANASVGTSAAMTAGAVTVATTASSATAKIFYARATTGGTTGDISITAQDGTGFTLTSTSNTETSTFNWWIINA